VKNEAIHASRFHFADANSGLTKSWKNFPHSREVLQAFQPDTSANLVFAALDGSVGACPIRL
jgi:hypothetical protein